MELNWKREKIQRFEAEWGYSPDLVNPKRFTEKMLCRILSDADPCYSLYGKKMEAYFFIKSLRIPGLTLPKKYGFFSALSPSDFDNIAQESFVIKSSYGSGLNFVIKNKTSCDPEKICKSINAKLYSKKNALAKTDPHNCIIIEEYIEELHGGGDEFKFHCFPQPNGEVFLIVVHLSGDGQSRKCRAYTEEFIPLDYWISKYPPSVSSIPKPREFDRAVKIAKILSRAFDYIRVDLLLIDGEVVFQELTPYSNGGLVFVPSIKRDLFLGQKWHMRAKSFDFNYWESLLYDKFE